MENLPRNLEKDVGHFTPPKPSKKKKGWTLLFVDAYGKTRRIRWFRTVALLWVFFLALAAATSACLYFLYTFETEKNKYLTSALQRSEQRVTSLEAEKEALMLRVNILESFDEGDMAAVREMPSETVPEETASDAEVAREDEADEAIAEPGEDAEPSDAETDEISEAREPVAETPPRAEPEKPLRIDAENLSLSYKKYRKTLNVKLDIRNVSPDSDRVSGHVFVVLKSDDMPENQWVTMPPSNLVSGKPSGDETGETFAISNFKTLKFQAKRQTNPGRFKTATVFIFDKDSSLMLEKDFPIRGQ